VPSRQMVLRLSEHLDVPLRDRNMLLVAAGYAPVYSETPIEEPRMDSVREALRQVLRGHEPYPAVLHQHDRHVRDAGRHHAGRAGDRGVLSGGLGDHGVSQRARRLVRLDHTKREGPVPGAAVMRHDDAKARARAAAP
jgi:hypothetical protein